MRALVHSSQGSWRAIFDDRLYREREENELDYYGSNWFIGFGRIRMRIGRRVTLLKCSNRWDSLRLQVPRCSRAILPFANGAWRSKDGVSQAEFRRKIRKPSKIEPSILIARRVDDLYRVGEAESNLTIVATSSNKEEKEIKELNSGSSSDADEKVDILNNLELQPNMIVKGWLTNLQRAFAGFLGFTPVQEGLQTVPTEPPGARFVWDGWGTSLCWWANFVGGLPQNDIDLVVDLIFDQHKGLGLNIARYNIGGGADLTFDTNLRPFSDLPGFKLSSDGNYDWSADERQRAVLLGAKARGANLFEAFSNSPPRWMTRSGSVTGNWWRGQDNLKEDCFGTFADFLTDVVLEYENSFGVHFNYLAPFNEPLEGFWNLDRKSNAQEGCNFSISSINKLILEVKSSLVRKGLSTEITAADSWSLNCPKLLRGLRKEVSDAISQINVHTYIPFPYREGDAKRWQVKESVAKLGKRLWMSEYGPLNLAGSELDIALAVGRHITLDINELQASAWCYWQVLEIPGEDFYWGLMHAEFKYEKNRVDPFEIQLKKQYYVMMHFSRWIRPGYTIIASEGQFTDWLVMAVDPSNNGRAVLVFTNTSDNNVDVKFDVSGVAQALKDSAIQTDLYRTSATENHKELVSVGYSSPVILVQLLAKSITTIVVSKANAA